MSSELENQIRDDLLRDKVKKFLFKYKKYLITLVILIITIPSFNELIKTYKQKKNEKFLENYSYALKLIAIDKEENKVQIFKILNDLLLSENENIVISSLNKIIDLSNKKKNIEIIDKILEKKNIRDENLNLLKIKKSLIIFDNADEQTMLKLLDSKNKDAKFYELSMSILRDYYISQNKFLKAGEVQKLIDAN